MMLDEIEADPFILLVHHRHSFLKFDPLRALFKKIIMPEGFPAHPHRGFETVFLESTPPLFELTIAFDVQLIILATPLARLRAR